MHVLIKDLEVNDAGEMTSARNRESMYVLASAEAKKIASHKFL